MCKIYLINVGANTSCRNSIRGPIFPNGSWLFLPTASKLGQPFPRKTRRFVRLDYKRCHLDPDWEGLTYGDHCSNRRARALLSVVPGDVLLFWSLLWEMKTDCSDIWHTQEKAWYLIGCLRVQHVLKS